MCACVCVRVFVRACLHFKSTDAEQQAREHLGRRLAAGCSLARPCNYGSSQMLLFTSALTSMELGEGQKPARLALCAPLSCSLDTLLHPHNTRTQRFECPTSCGFYMSSTSSTDNGALSLSLPTSLSVSLFLSGGVHHVCSSKLER